MITLYGIKNCDTMKKAMAWLDRHKVDYTLHDYRKDGLDPDQLDRWFGELGWDALLNRRGTTWRQLPQAVRERIDESSARTLMLDNPAIIKRPLLDTGRQRLVGFQPESYAGLLV